MIHDTRPCELGEGPLWHPTRNELFWFDILNRTLHSKARSCTFPDYVSAAGWISADERRQLEELREITLDTISVDDFDVHELRAASYYDLPQQRRQPREAA